MYVSFEVSVAVYLTGTNVTPRGRVSGFGLSERACRVHRFKAHQECIAANLSEVLGFAFGATASTSGPEPPHSRGF